MKKLSELYDVDSDVLIKSIKINSKEVKDGDLFVCTMGVSADRHDYLDEAIKNGAKAAVVSKDVGEKSIPIIKVLNTNDELSKLCQKFYDYDENKLTLIGITGTDGKTSTATIVQTLIGKDKCGYIGTNGRSWKDKELDDNPNTTPDETILYKFLNDFTTDGCSYAVMEASSEAYFRQRLNNLKFDASCYTNITKEHLNIHKTFDNYKECKKMLFKNTKENGICVLNKDDEFFEEMKESCKGRVLSYGKENATLTIKNYEVFPTKTLITLVYNEKEYEVVSPLLGEFNVYNLSAGILICLGLGFEFEKLIENIKNIKISGRLEMLDTDIPYYVMVDYAHTPNGIKKLLDFVHTLDINRSIVVIGSAGERDFLKRPIMGKTVLDNATYAIFTYEDPRSEDPIDIINMLISDVKDKYNNYEIEVDRATAIRKAINMAKEKDMILVLGKGNETYQKLKNETIYFNDIEECYKAVRLREAEESVKEG